MKTRLEVLFEYFDRLIAAQNAGYYCPEEIAEVIELICEELRTYG